MNLTPPPRKFYSVKSSAQRETSRDKCTLTPLPRTFYRRNTHVVARELLGKLLVREVRQKKYIERIVETESYVGEDDLACHASRGRTPRTEIMYGPAGFAYVYLIYGMYHMLNIVTEEKDFPAAVLIRALEPVASGPAPLETALSPKVKRLQPSRGDLSLTGPGRLCRALSIDRSLNGHDVTKKAQLYIADDDYTIPASDIATSPRIGVAYAKHCAKYPWRYYLKNSQFVSSYRKNP